MIIHNEPLSMVEASEHVEKDEQGKELIAFIKKFNNLKPSEAKDFKKKLTNLEILKLNVGHVCKIVDFLPETTEDLNKVLADANLDEDENKKILDTIKEFK